MKGMTTCEVCGRDFPLTAEEHYVARGIEKKGVSAAISIQDEVMQYDAFDCPHCGCQNIVQERKQKICPCECMTSETEDGPEETFDHDGCDGCKYRACTCEEEPCKSCKYNHLDNYEKEDDNE